MNEDIESRSAAEVFVDRDVRLEGGGTLQIIIISKNKLKNCNKFNEQVATKEIHYFQIK